ncbi:Vacuolar protein sorting 37B [Operophtera brumata]|uniref:Vacuolar protein sorting 37B n=1 Tax=Operophtera brumata TaxID=104452 RepID=A0A0L7KJR1_OPEBR|nr:Vacuolar protein sorting 37B [Operophtera brumata]
MIQPDYPSAMGLLAHLNSDELKELLNDDSKFDETVLKDVKQVKDWETEREMIIASNRSLAEFNLSKEPEVDDLKTQVQQKSELGEQLYFLSGKIGIEKFLEDFEPLRKKMHVRKFKAEKMTELLRPGNQSSYGNGFTKPYLPYPSYGPPQGVPSVPYPVGPLNMPMPGMYGNHF